MTNPNPNPDPDPNPNTNPNLNPSPSPSPNLLDEAHRDDALGEIGGLRGAAPG